MTRHRAPSEALLRRAARIAAQEGVTFTIEAADGTLVRISPDAAPSPMGVTERDAAACDKAFGL